MVVEDDLRFRSLVQSTVPELQNLAGRTAQA